MDVAARPGWVTGASMRHANRRTLLLLACLTLLAFIIRIYHLTYQGLWRDEVDALRFATQPLPALLNMFRQPGENGPLFFLSLRPWLALAGTSEFALRFPSAWAGTLAVPVIFALVRRLGRYAHLGREGRATTAAFVAALLMATAPYLIWYGQEAKMYALLTAVIPLSLWLTIEASERGGWLRWLALYVLTSLCFYTHLLAALIVPVQILWLLCLPTGPGAGRRRLMALAYPVALALPYLPLAVWQLPVIRAATFRPGQSFVPLPDIFAVLAVAFSRGILPVDQPLTALPLMLALLAGLGLWAPVPAKFWRSRSLPPAWRVVALLAVWLFLPPLEIYAISLSVPVFLDRYLIWIMPALLALAGLGVVTLAQAARPLGLLTLGAILVFNLDGVRMQTTQPIKADFRSAAHYVMSHRQPDDLLIFQIPYNRFTFSYYSGPDITWMDGPYTNRGENAATVDAWMKPRVGDHQHVWLIASEVSLWDNREMTLQWLNSHGHVTDRAQFTRVDVIHYDLAP
jgi:mannosyltransferase